MTDYLVKAYMASCIRKNDEDKNMRDIMKKAKEDAKNAPLPLMVMGVCIPKEYYDFNIDDFWYSEKKIGARITKVLNDNGIYTIKDFQNHPDIAWNIRNATLGIGMENEFITALKQVIGEMPATTPASGFIAGIEIPPKFHDVEIWQLDYKSKITQSKATFALRGKDIIRVKDLFKPENADITKLGLGKTALNSFLEALERTMHKNM